LSAAVAGEIFTFLPVEVWPRRHRSDSWHPGALSIVKNYTGDRLNFDWPQSSPAPEGTLVETVTIADDVALASTGSATMQAGVDCRNRSSSIK